MPKIDFCFSGWVRGAEITQATNSEGQTVDVSQMPTTELVQKLEAGELTVSLGDHLYASRKNEVEMFDWTPSND